MGWTSWKTVGTVSSETRTGGSVSWSNPDNAKVDDTSYAIALALTTSVSSHWLRCTNFGFTTGDVPTGKTITSVEVRMVRSSIVSGDIVDAEIFLRTASGRVGSDQAENYDNAPEWDGNTPSTDTYSGLGTWGATILDTDVRASTFGFDLAAIGNTAGTDDAYVDFVEMRVKHETPAPPPYMPGESNLRPVVQHSHAQRRLRQ